MQRPATQNLLLYYTINSSIAYRQSEGFQSVLDVILKSSIVLVEIGFILVDRFYNDIEFSNTINILNFVHVSVCGT